MKKLIVSIASVMVYSLALAQIPLDSAVHTGILANGFTYYIRHNAEPKNRVQLYLVNKVGSILEDEDQRGLAHFMEHMNFNGTKHFPKNQLVDYLQKSGVRFGADLNAYTSFDETVYQLPIPTDDPAILQSGFEIMRDWAQDATLDSTEIEKERGVVLEEKRLGKGASERMQRQYFPMLLNDSHYADRLPIGLEDILNNFRPAVIRRFHHDWYRPDLQALVVVGDIDVRETEALVKKMFGDLVNPPGEKTRQEYTVPLTGRNQFMAVTDPEMPVIALQVLVKHPAEKLITEENYMNSMKHQLCNQMLGERFEELSQQANPPFVEAGGGINGFLGGLDIFSFNITAREGKLQQGFQTAWEVVEKVKRFGFLETELDRAKQGYLAGMEASFREKDKTNSVSLVGEYQRLFLHQEASPGIGWEYNFVKENLKNISIEGINAVIKEYIKDQNRDILILAPAKDKSSLPDSATVTGWIQTVAGENLTAYSDQVSSQPLLPVLPRPGKVIASTRVPSLGVTKMTLSNGVTVILKPTDFKNDEVQFTGFKPGGTSLYSNSDFASAASAGNLTAGFGVGAFNPIELGKALTGKRVNVTPYIDERSEGISGGSAPKDLATALQLVYLWFTQPRRDTVLFNNTINSSRELLASRYSDPNNVFRDTVNYVLGNYHYRASPPSLQKLQEINADKVYHIYRQRFADASGFTFIFVGHFSPDSIRPLLERYLGGLPSLHTKEAPRDLGIHIPYGQLTRKVYKGTENKATVRMVFSGAYTFSPENNIELRGLSEVLQIKITQHLREDESEVYSPSVQVTYDKYPRSSYAFTISFGCAPANADHLMEMVSKEVAGLRGRIAEEDVEKFKAEYRRTHELQLRNNGYWLAYLANQYENREEVLQVLDYNARLEKVSAASLERAAKEYLDGSNLLKFVLLPQTKP